MKKMDRYCYIDLIDETKTKAEAIKWLNFLAMFNENEILDYLHYSRSVIEIQNQPNRYSADQKYLEAIEKKDLKAKQIQRVMKGIESLEDIEKKILIAKYLHGKIQGEICEQLCISESTYKRRLKSGYLHLAMKLGIEVLKLPS